MVVKLIAQIPERQLTTLFQHLNSEGKLIFVNLLLAERQSLSQFSFNYESPELRRIARRQELGETLSEADALALSSAKRVFSGKLVHGEIIDDPTAIAYVNSIATLHDRLRSRIEELARSTDGGTSSEPMILGEKLSSINTNPARLADLLYESYFATPVEVLAEVRRLLEIRLQATDIVTLFVDLNHLESQLRPIGVDVNKFSTEIDAVARIEVKNSATISDLRAVIIKLLTIAQQADDSFSDEAYVQLKPYFPQYHKVSVRWWLWFLTHLGYQTAHLSSAIDLETLLAFYRKGVELTC